MSKSIYLICNAHIDPIWQWEWEEGAAECLSTFRIAADFCEQFDRFVFCHNEALLYRWVEEYDPPLFEKIKRLVAQGKWHIMGGWFLQPDCNMPSGEAIVRQIAEGRQYFWEKFGVRPRIATNVDSFGHSRGLVQILTKTGYTGYLFQRPMCQPFIALPSDEIMWEGYDGSKIMAIRLKEGYSSGRGVATQKIERFITACPNDDICLCLWGVGNHGGGPSKKDLEDIEILAAQMKEQDVSLMHSTPEQYFESALQKHTLSLYAKSLNSWGVGCYTSQIRVKQQYRKTENEYFLTEMMASHAARSGQMTYPEAELHDALYDLLTAQFHDVLPGTSIQPAEASALRLLGHAQELLSRVKARAFFALSDGQKKAQEDKIPILIYNPYPYTLPGDFSCEFMLWDQDWTHAFLAPTVYDEQGRVCPSQCEKELSSIPLEWRKRVVFHASLAPMSMNRFDCAFSAQDQKPAHSLPHTDTHYCFEKGDKKLLINRNTGLLDAWQTGEKTYVQENACPLLVFKDDFDRWGMNTTGYKEQTGRFTLLTPEETMEYLHVKKPLDSVHIIESGEVRTVVEAVFGYQNSRAVVRYILSDHEEGIRVDIQLFWMEKQKMVKWCIPASFAPDECIGEHIYGAENLKKNKEENVSQRYIMLCSGQDALAVINNCVYGSSFDDQNGCLYVTLLRSPSYTAHPLGPSREVMRQDRFVPYIDQGEREYSFLLTAGTRAALTKKVPRMAQHFNMAPTALSYYPSAKGSKPTADMSLSGDTVMITAIKRSLDQNGYTVRLFNPTPNECNSIFSIQNTAQTLVFHAFEIKTMCFKNGRLLETDLLESDMR